MKKIFIFALSIFLIIIIVPMLSLSVIEKNVDGDDSKIIDNSYINKDSQIITVYDVNEKKTFSIEMEEYLKGVVASEMPAEFGLEALKAQAITARTYLIHHLKKYESGHPDHPKAAICTGVHCQVYHSIDTLKLLHSEEWYKTYWSKIETAVTSTSGQILIYEGKLIEPLFHSTSGGRTENSEDVFVSAMPYLRSVESPYEDGSPKLHSSINLSVNDFISKINKSFGKSSLNINNLKDNIKLLEVSEGGKVKSVKVGDFIVSGRDIRSAFNLNSTNFKFVQNNNQIEIVTTGYGHGVGMSQWGANGMSQNGSSCEEILKHYYTGVEITNISE